MGNQANLVNVHGTGGVATTFVGGQVKTFQNFIATATLSGVLITGGTTGGISNLGALTISNCTITNNTSLFNGGVYNAGTMTMTNSKVTGNTAPQNGGGIYNTNSGSLYMANCLISGNSAVGKGGGIYNAGGLTVINTTVSGNSASGGGAGFYNTGNALLENSILYADTGSELVNTGNLTVNNSDIQTGWTGPGMHNLPANSNPDFDANLQLQTGSPCIDTGYNGYVYGSKDLAGKTRVIGGTVDMGAYENQGAIVLVYAPGPPAVVTAGVTLPTVVVDVEQNGSLTTLQDGTLVILTVDNAQVGSAVVSGGQAKFSNLVFNTTGHYSLIASDGNDGTVTQQFSVISGAPTFSLQFSGLPVGITAQQVLPEFGVELLSGGQIDTGNHSIISLYLDNTNTLLGTAQVGANNAGFALFNNIEFPTSGVHYIQARDTADSITLNSANIQVSAAAVISTLFFGPVPEQPRGE